jgi:hypothetical protein
MTDDTFNARLTAVAGVLLTVFLFAGFLLPGAPPTADDSVKEIVDFLVEKRGSILAGDVFIAFGSMFLLVFAGGLRRHLRAAGRGGDDGLADTSFGGAVGGVVLLLAGAALLNGIAFKAGGTGEPVRAWFDALNDLFFLAGFPFAVFFGFASWAGARTRAFPAWLGWLGGLVAVVNLLGGIGLFAKSGAFASGGAFAFIPPVAGTIWALAISWRLFRGAGQPAASGGS